MVINMQFGIGYADRLGQPLLICEEFGMVKRTETDFVMLAVLYGDAGCRMPGAFYTCLWLVAASFLHLVQRSCGLITVP